MYLATVILLIFIFPIGSSAIEGFVSHAPFILLAGKWFVFWGVGVRLFTAGMRQLIQPSFTSRQIFGMQSDDPLPFVQELGAANAAMGLGGILSLPFPAYVLPLAVIGGIFYGIVGVRHVAQPHRSWNQTLPMLTDLFMAVVLGVYVFLV